MKTSPGDPAPILVGYADRASDSALSWAAAEAGRRHLPLRVLHAYPPAADLSWAWGYRVSTGDQETVHEVLRDAATGALSQVATQLRTSHPDLAFTTTAVGTSPSDALVTASADASMLVVTHGRHHVAGTLGSTAAAVASHAACPVVVIPERSDSAGDGASPFAGSVVVGLDDSPECEDALRFAFDAAALRDVPLVPLHAFWLDPRFLPAGYPSDWGKTDADAEFAVDALVARWAPAYPQVRTVPERPLLRPADALIEASRSADLVVVGSRGRGGFGALLLGSVSRRLLHRTHCPVAVVRRGQWPEPAGEEGRRAEHRAPVGAEPSH